LVRYFWPLPSLWTLQTHNLWAPPSTLPISYPCLLQIPPVKYRNTPLDSRHNFRAHLLFSVMDISKILNLSNEACHTHCSSGNTTPASTPHLLAPLDLPRRQKVPKDAPIFSEGNKVVGFVNYPPHESGDDRTLLAQHRKFKIFPLGQIYSKGIRHIPYNSDKKDFLEKTGREAFEGEYIRMLLHPLTYREQCFTTPTKDLGKTKSMSLSGTTMLALSG
jgi:hypothetical protein